jgi:hypothetical protein
MTIIATGIDLAKNVFAVHGVNDAGKVELRQPKVARAKLNVSVQAWHLARPPADEVRSAATSSAAATRRFGCLDARVAGSGRP